MKALLVIDMQKGSFQPYESRHDAPGVISRINRLAEHFRSRQYPVIYIQHDGTSENCFIPGTGEWELLPEMSIRETDMIVGKTANDAFYRTSLQEILEDRNVQELYITGCATDYCVDTTIKSALSKEYKITVVADGHTTDSKPDIEAGILVNYYNWIWSDLAATRYRIEVVKAADITL